MFTKSFLPGPEQYEEKMNFALTPPPSPVGTATLSLANNLPKDFAFSHSYSAFLPDVDTRGLSLNAQCESTREVRAKLMQIPNSRGSISNKKAG